MKWWFPWWIRIVCKHPQIVIFFLFCFLLSFMLVHLVNVGTHQTGLYNNFLTSQHAIKSIINLKPFAKQKKQTKGFVFFIFFRSVHWKIRAIKSVIDKNFHSFLTELRILVVFFVLLINMCEKLVLLWVKTFSISIWLRYCYRFHCI